MAAIGRRRPLLGGGRDLSADGPPRLRQLRRRSICVREPATDAGADGRGIAWAFTTTQCHNWHPLTWLSYLLDCQLYGLNAGGHHLTNVLLHAATAILLFLVLWRMTGDLWPSAFVAAVFAIHPLRVESVAWVAERKDVLSGLFFMLTLGAYVGYVRRPFSLARYLTVVRAVRPGADGQADAGDAAVCAAAVGLLAAGAHCRSAVAPWRRVGRHRRDRCWLLVGEASAACCWRPLPAWRRRWRKDAIAMVRRVPFPRIANALVSYVAYLGQFFYPVGLAGFYPHPRRQSAASWKVAGALSAAGGRFRGAWSLAAVAPICWSAGSGIWGCWCR